VTHATTIAIDEITIPEGRRELRGVDELAKSISEIGLLNPIVVTKGRRLIAGAHRLEACRRLGWRYIPAAVVEYDELHAELAEIDENLVRNELSVLERSEAYARRKEIYEALHPEARSVTERGGPGRGKKTSETISPVSAPPSFAADTAAKTGKSPRTIQHEVQIATKIPEPVREAIRNTRLADSKSDLIALARERDPERQAAIAEKVIKGEARNVAQAARAVEQEERIAKAPKVVRPDVRVYCGDAVASLRDLRPAAHCVVMDPPYGLETHRTRAGGKDYADGEDYALALLRDACAELARCLVPGAHLYVFSGYSYVFEFKRILGEFFEVQDNPLIWVKSNHTMADFSRWYASKHEYVLFAKQRGADRKLGAGHVADVFQVSHDRSSTHSAEKPVELLKHFIERSTAPGETVIDPFCGSGSTGVAALQLGRSFVGVEVDEKWANVARTRLAEVRP